MRRVAKVDDNQKAIVEALKACGCDVQSLASVGAGVPDLLVGRAGRNYLLEVKGAKGKLNERQVTWHGQWRGEVTVVRDEDEALRAVGLISDDELMRVIEEASRGTSITAQEEKELLQFLEEMETKWERLSGQGRQGRQGRHSGRGHVCQQCGEVFTAKRKDAKYCSARCRKAASRKRARK